jgi:hypothetical protein
MGVCWITADMRKDLLQSGEILFLDAQQKQRNELFNWACIGPVIKDNNMQV